MIAVSCSPESKTYIQGDRYGNATAGSYDQDLSKVLASDDNLVIVGGSDYGNLTADEIATVKAAENRADVLRAAANNVAEQESNVGNRNTTEADRTAGVVRAPNGLIPNGMRRGPVPHKTVVTDATSQYDPNKNY